MSGEARLKFVDQCMEQKDLRSSAKCTAAGAQGKSHASTSARHQPRSSDGGAPSWLSVQFPRQVIDAVQDLVLYLRDGVDHEHGQ